jgi:hypothetical protein
MELKENFKLKKNLLKYSCEFCNFTCYQKCDWDRHIIRPKHISNQAGNVEEIKKLEKTFSCICGRQFKTNSGLWKHQSKCDITSSNHNISKDEPSDKDLILKILKQNSDLIKENSELRKEHTDIKELILEIVKNGTMNNSNNTTHTNSHNKAFNLNFFLNETCKNAMNITDFVDSIKLQLTDLMEVGELGYVEGISKIIVKNLNNLDETVRPIHCTDKKRETMYIKDQGNWEKEDDNKTRLKKVINKVVDKNIRLLPQFREKYPEYRNASSKISDVHDKLVIEVMETDNDKKDKIISNISKSTTITKGV